MMCASEVSFGGIYHLNGEGPDKMLPSAPLLQYATLIVAIPYVNLEV